MGESSPLKTLKVLASVFGQALLSRWQQAAPIFMWRVLWPAMYPLRKIFYFFRYQFRTRFKSKHVKESV